MRLTQVFRQAISEIVSFTGHSGEFPKLARLSQTQQSDCLGGVSEPEDGVEAIRNWSRT